MGEPAGESINTIQKIAQTQKPQSVKKSVIEFKLILLANVERMVLVSPAPTTT